MRRLGWGVIGIGSIVNGTIAPAMVAESSCELVAGVSRSRDRADAFAARFDVPSAYTDYQAMLEDPAVEAVFIATPNALHPDQVVAAARAGKHILCDKPLALDTESALRAVRAASDAGVSLGVNFHNRFLPWVRDVGRMIAAGDIGDPLIVEVEVASGTRRWDNWRADPEMAGLGTIHNVGVHALDFLRVILGSEPVEVTALFDRPAGADEVEYIALVLLRFANGTLVSVNANEAVPYPSNGITIHGSEGRIVGSGFTRAPIDGELRVLRDGEETVTEYPAPAAHRALVATFTAAVLAGEEPNPNGIDGLRSVELCEAIARSVDERRTVSVEPRHP
jgi:1,5-anhydro-D-fructose reductase (1,5-anhydro-D-mannitol-forming)